MIGMGLFAYFHAQRYEFGELQRMGPGYFPVALGVLLAILGLFIMIPAFFRPGTSIKLEWNNLLWVTVGIIAFSLLLDKLGLVLTSALMIILSSMPAVGMGWKERIILAVVVALITYLIFSFGLGMVIPVWPWSY